MGGKLEQFYNLSHLFPFFHGSFTVFEKFCFIYFVFILVVSGERVIVVPLFRLGQEQKSSTMFSTLSTLFILMSSWSMMFD